MMDEVEFYDFVKAEIKKYPKLKLLSLKVSGPKGICGYSAYRQRASEGGKARAEALSPERRKEIAKAAAKTRWKSGNE